MSDGQINGGDWSTSGFKSQIVAEIMDQLGQRDEESTPQPVPETDRIGLKTLFAITSRISQIFVVVVGVAVIGWHQSCAVDRVRVEIESKIEASESRIHQGIDQVRERLGDMDDKLRQVEIDVGTLKGRLTAPPPSR